MSSPIEIAREQKELSSHPDYAACCEETDVLACALLDLTEVAEPLAEHCECYFSADDCEAVRSVLARIKGGQ